MKKLILIVIWMLCGAAFAQQGAIPENFVRVEGGTFQMGSNDGDSDARPVHRVTVSSFYMAKHEVTQKEWRDVMGTTVRQQRDMASKESSESEKRPMRGEGDNYPMYYVSWYEAVAYCNKRSVKEGLTPAYKGSRDSITFDRNANGYRLPTEAEWEYAAKGGNKNSASDYSGSNSVGTVAWYEKNSGGTTHPVGTKAPNELGIYDMSGNVGEWVFDGFGAYRSASQTDPVGASSGSRRVNRGGSWLAPAAYVRSADRGYPSPSLRNYDLGFRLVRPSL